MDDAPLFLAEEPDAILSPALAPWKVLIADDEPGIHQVTKIVLADLQFEGRGLEFLDAFSSREAEDLLRRHSDVAVILLDVVMESEHSGLDTAKFIREDLGNRNIRIILRTGQPGQAPERHAILAYDINDYKEKSDLTSQKLFTTLISALRSYRDILALEQSKRGLENIIHASLPLFKTEKTVERFAGAVLSQLTTLLDSDRSFLSLKESGFAAYGIDRHFEIISGTPPFVGLLHQSLNALKDEGLRQRINQVIDSRQSLYLDDEFIGYFHSQLGFETILYLKTNHALSELDKHLLKIFSTNITLAFDNVTLNQDAQETQKEILFTISDVVETRSKETAQHVRRVALCSTLLGRLAGLSDSDLDLLASASPLHDLGKIGIPDSILSKPRPLAEAERAIMQTHTTIGYDILRKSARAVPQAAARIAHQHHECWDGSGYPQGLAGDAIDLFARITKIADVFDALGQARAYKEAWAADRIRAHLEAGRGSAFDPRLLDLFLAHFDEFCAIRAQYPEG